MHMIVLFLLLLLCQNNSYARLLTKENNIQINTQEPIPFVVFICENYRKKQEKVTVNYNKKIVEDIRDFKFISRSSWTLEVQ